MSSLYSYSTWLYVCFTWVLYSIVCVFGQTHPNIDKKLFLAESQIGLKNPDKPFPLNQDVGVLKWRLQTQDEALIPLSSESCVPRCDLIDLNIGREVWVLYHSCLFLGVVYKFCLRLWKLFFFFLVIVLENSYRKEGKEKADISRRGNWSLDWLFCWKWHTVQEYYYFFRDYLGLKNQ